MSGDQPNSRWGYFQKLSQLLGNSQIGLSIIGSLFYSYCKMSGVDLDYARLFGTGLGMDGNFHDPY